MTGKYPSSRFVKLRVPAQQHPAATITMLAADPAVLPTPENNGLLQQLKQSQPERYEQVAAGLSRLLEREHEFFTWLEASPEHTLAFVKDPLAAILQALPDLDAAFLGDRNRPGSER